MFGDNVVEVNTLSWLCGNCKHKGCKFNKDGFCDAYESLNVGIESTMNDLRISYSKATEEVRIFNPNAFFYCSAAEPINEDTCLCGSPLLYKNDDKNFDGMVIQNTIRYCPNCDE